MSNRKCHYCGFINFLTAEVCRKCESMLGSADQLAPAYAQPGQYNFQNPYQQPRAPKGFPILKVSVAVLLGLILLPVGMFAIATLRSTTVSWQEFRPRESEMTFMMPTEPKVHDPMVTPTMMGSVTHHIYESIVRGQGSAALCVVEYPREFPEDFPIEAVLSAEVDAALKRTNSTLISKRNTTVDGFRALEFEMTPPSNLTPRIEKGFGKLILTSDRLYMLLFLAKQDSALFKDKDRFLNSQTFGNAKQNAKL